MDPQEVQAQLDQAIINGTAGTPVRPEHIERWRSRLPAALLHLWEGIGFGRLREDRIALMDPDDLGALVAFVFQGDPDFGGDVYPIAIGSFGELFLWSERNGIGFMATTAYIVEFPYLLAQFPPGADEQIVRVLLNIPDVALDQLDVDGQPLRAALQARHGVLEPGQIYGALPAPPEPGRKTVADYRRVDADAYIEAIVTQIGFQLFDSSQPNPILREIRSPWPGPSPVPQRR